MKLYSSPGACSTASVIVATEANLDIEIIKVDLKTHTLADGKNFYEINSLGYVPFLVLDNGKTINEGPAIIQYLADLAPNSGLLAPIGDYSRYKAIQWLNYIATEIHKIGFAPFFNPNNSQENLDIAKNNLIEAYKYTEEEIKNTNDEILLVADIYLFVVSRWLPATPVKIDNFPNVKRFLAEIEKRPKVQEALKKEGLPTNVFS